MARKPMRRRDLLLGLGAGAAFLSPFVRSLRAQAAGKPGMGNFLMFFTPNGFARSQFGSDGSDAAFKLRPGLSGAEAMKDHISVVRGLSQKAQHPGRPFHDQITRLLTCVPGNNVGSAMGPSIDHVVAKLSDTAPMNLKVYRSYTRNTGTYENLSWKAAGIPSGNINDPREVYKAVFGSFMPSGTGAEASAVLEQEKSMLDFLQSEIGLVRGRLGPAERTRMEAHLEAVRQVEKRLSQLPGTSGVACDANVIKAGETTAPPKDGGPGTYDPPAFAAHGDLQSDLIVTAFACGLRNAATLMWQAGASGINPNGGVGKADDHHNVSHRTAPYDVWMKIDQWYSGRFARVLGQLQKQGILDDTVVVWGTEIAEDHSHNNCTFVVGGGRALGIQHRKTLVFPFNGSEGGGLGAAQDARNKGIADLWVSVQKACGVQSDSFGTGSTGGIEGLWKPA